MKIEWLVCVMWLFSPAAWACIHDSPDAQAVRWSAAIVRGKLVGVSERIDMKTVVLKAEKGKPETTAYYWYRLYSFEVEEAIDGSPKPGHRIEVARFFGKTDSAMKPAAGPRAVDPCARQLHADSIGKSMILMVRLEQELKIEAPPVWPAKEKPEPRDGEMRAARAYGVIHLIEPARAAAPGLAAELKKFATTTRAADKKISDEAIKTQIARILAVGKEAASKSDAESAEAELRKMGFRAASAVKSARDKKETSPEAKERLEALYAELQPPPLKIEMTVKEE